VSLPQSTKRTASRRFRKPFDHKLTREIFKTIKMKHLAAFLLLGLGGNTSPSAKDIKAVLSSVGIEADDERLSALLSELKGKDINEVRIGSHTPAYLGRLLKYPAADL